MVIHKCLDFPSFWALLQGTWYSYSAESLHFWKSGPGVVGCNGQHGPMWNFDEKKEANISDILSYLSFIFGTLIDALILLVNFSVPGDV